MTYANLLQERFPSLDPQVDDLFLLEAHQIAHLPTRAPSRELAAVGHAYPRVRRFLVARHPPIEEYLDQLLAGHGPVMDDELLTCETALLWEIADWIVYQRAPQRYDEWSEFDPGLIAITDVVALDGKVVIDAGAGTGQIAFAASQFARHIFAVEPVATLRSYMRVKAERRQIEMPHPAPPDDEWHLKLVANGYQPCTYHEGSTVKRKYWKQFEVNPSTG